MVERVRLRELAWGSAEHLKNLCSEFGSNFDLVIGSDVVYVEEFVPPLFRTVKALLSNKNQVGILPVKTLTRVVPFRIIIPFRNIMVLNLKTAMRMSHFASESR